MSSGWIKLHRQFRDSPYYKVGAATQTWLECLLRASHEPREVFLKRNRVTLVPGQFVMGRDEFGASIGISGSTAWYWLCQFKADSMIDISASSKGSLVTVKRWAEYQTVDSTSDNRKTASEQQKNTNKKDKNEKNDKTTGIDNDILDELRRHETIGNPSAYLSALKRKAKPEAIRKAWGEWKRGSGIESPADFYARCIHWSKL